MRRRDLLTGVPFVLAGCLGLGTQGAPPTLQLFEIFNTRPSRVTIDVRVAIDGEETLRETHDLSGVRDGTADVVVIDCAWPPQGDVVLAVRLRDEPWVTYGTGRISGDCVAVEARVIERGVWFGHATGPCPLPDGRCHG